MQSLAAWLRSRERSLVEPREIGDWLSHRGEGPWWAIIRNGLEEFGRDAGEGAVLAADVLDWLADWGRSVRRRQSGLLLLTAHSAKGLEFDDVVVLDEGWERSDAERRLYYVAMTRARRSLALMRFSERHPMLDGLGDDSAFMIRRAMEATIDISDCRKRYQRLDLSEVDLGYAGRLLHEHPALASLQRLSAGDRVGLKRNGERFLIVSDDGHVVGRLAEKYVPPDGLHSLLIPSWGDRRRPRREARTLQGYPTPDGEDLRSWRFLLPE
jgi:ATP-dependent DNA helicase RecQ